MACCPHDSTPLAASVAATPAGALSRRDWLARLLGLGGAALLAPSLVDLVVREAAAQAGGGGSGAKKHLILLWMAGGPSQIDTFDPKPGAPTQGRFGVLPTDRADWLFSQHLPKLRDRAGSLAVLRTLRSTEGSHSRASDLLHFGYTPTPAIPYPTLGSIVAHQLGDADHPLPPFVQIDGMPGTSGYLGVEAAPFMVRNPTGKIDNLNYRRGVDAPRMDRREELRGLLEAGFAERGGAGVARANESQRRRARRLMDTELVSAFALEQESDAVRDRYGRGRFGQGVLLARRLVERGVAAVEVVLRGWDTHNDNFNTTKGLCDELDPAFAQLIDDLQERGLHDDTLVVCMGEFGRTPRINPTDGRDHWINNACVAFSGGGTKGGTVVGTTDATGEQTVDAPVTVADLFATVAKTLTVSGEQILTPDGMRPTALIDPEGKPVDALLKG
ncbi:MAG: DUF1501 domain-containing protein [Planctomycetes bacterium]|nr:DUF1501 domain-containing protein [Planctomycetota bacterium]